jgi:hypothetical protein
MAADEEEPTLQWPAPAEEDTDPVGFEPVDYPPAVDPFVPEEEPQPAEERRPAEAPLSAEEQAWGTPRRSRRLLVAGLALAVALGGMTAVILVASRHHTAPPSASPREGDRGPTAVTGPVDGRTSAVFDLVDGAASVRVTARDLGGDLYRISSPAGSAVAPRVDSDRDGVRVRLAGTGGSAPAQVEIVLTTAVRWAVRLDGGTRQTAVDLSGAHVDSVDLGGGANRIDLTLPTPTGPMPVRLTGGVDQFRVRLSDATPVRVRVQSGAGEVTLGGTTHRGIAPGQSFTAYGWKSGAAGIDLFAVAGMSALTVTAAS